VIERTFKSGVSTGATVPDLEEKEVEYMYADTEGFNFMDQANFETIHLTTEQVGDDRYYLQEGSKLTVLYYKGRPINIELPNFIILKVTETDPGLKGDTAAGAMKKLLWKRAFKCAFHFLLKKASCLKSILEMANISKEQPSNLLS